VDDFNLTKWVAQRLRYEKLVDAAIAATALRSPSCSRAGRAG